MVAGGRDSTGVCETLRHRHWCQTVWTLWHQFGAKMSWVRSVLGPKCLDAWCAIWCTLAVRRDSVVLAVHTCVYMCVWSYGTSWLTQYLINCSWKFQQIYNFGAVGDKGELKWKVNLPVQQRIEHKVCVLVYKCLHQHISLYCAHRCLNQPIVISEVSCGTAAVDCFGTGGRSKAGCDPEARLRHSSSWLTTEGRTATACTTHPTLHEIRYQCGTVHWL